ncbi:DUF4249 domain-containing protein [Sphingobacterium sp. Mn56C]|uniref:DUF4249 domain-containing protein n=1 Tax=Sphingobacterium sp. Mn56C TaxID=3395261 RepID=UPI003BC0983D
MKKYNLYSLIVFVLALTSSCEKVIDIKVNDEVGKLVIEGIINQTDTVQKIILSRNVSFTGSNTYPGVSGATVTVRDSDNKTYVFRETTTGTYIANPFIGEPGKTYSMEVQVDNETYRAQAQLPQLVPLDSISAEKPKIGDKDTRNIKIYFKDPQDQQNQYRFVLYVNNKQTKDIYALDDNFTNGNEVSLTLRPDDLDIFPGDNVRVEMFCIDRALYTYWYSLMQQSGGGGITPSNPPTNISPSVLGYFSAHSQSSKSITIE